MKQLGLTMSLAVLIMLFSSSLESKPKQPKLDEFTALNLRVAMLEHKVNALASYANYLFNYSNNLEWEIYRLEGNQLPTPRDPQEDNKI